MHKESMYYLLTDSISAAVAPALPHASSMGSFTQLFNSGSCAAVDKMQMRICGMQADVGGGLGGGGGWGLERVSE